MQKNTNILCSILFIAANFPHFCDPPCHCRLTQGLKSPSTSRWNNRRELERSYSGKAGWAHGRESLRQLKKPNRTQRCSQQINELTVLPVYISDKSFCLKPSQRRDPGSLLPDSRHNMVFPNVFKNKYTSAQITEKMCFWTINKFIDLG